MPNVNISGAAYTLSLLKGTQKILPNKKTTDRDLVTLLMCILRFREPYNTDLLFTLNVPDKFDNDDIQDKYPEFLKQTEFDFYHQLLPSFVVSGDQALKDLLGME